MSGPKESPANAKVKGQDVYTETANLAKRLVTQMLLRMIESAATYSNWSLSDEDGARVVKLIRHKQRMLCSSFVFQLNRDFKNFAASDPAREREGAAEWQKLGLSSADANVEISELKAITERYSGAFGEFERTILKRLQTCVRRSRASRFENPLHVKSLCESFQYAIDSLNLELNFKLALYRLFADRFVEALGPFYRRIDAQMRDRGMLPEMPAGRIHLRDPEGLSESRPPAGLLPDQSICLLLLLQSFKEKSRAQSGKPTNLFPELKRRFAAGGISEYDSEIDQLGTIFKLILEDEDLPAPVKHQLARLQVYVFITAIQEKGFLRRSSNPARRLLEGIINREVEIAKSGRAEFSGIRFIRERIDELTAREFITVDSYAEMLDGYFAYLKENETATRRKRRLEAAKSLLPVVKSRIDEITQPLRIQGTSLILFEKVWCPLLVQIALQRGMDSDPWYKALEMVKKQVWSMIPKSTPEEKQELLKTLPQVGHSLHRAMRSLKLAEKLQQSMRDYLKLAQQSVVEQTEQNIVAAKRKSRSLGEQSFAATEDTTDFDAMMQTGVFQVPTDMLEAMNAAKPKEPKKINQVEALGVGDWVNMLHEDEKILAKLAWKAEDSSLFIFVDRDGTRICENSAVELGQRFESGEISLLESGTGDAEKARTSFMKTL